MALVSVLLPTFARNKSGMLCKAIESVLSQDMADLELFVLDDGSTDGTSDTVHQIAKSDARVKHIRFDVNIGLPALTTAYGFRESSGQYIAWQFDDCEWRPDHLSSLLALSNANPEAGIVYGQVLVHTPTGEHVFGLPFDRDALQQSNFIPNCSTLIRRTVYETVGWIAPNVLLKRTNDYDLWVRASKQFDFAFLPQVVAVEKGQSLPDSLGNSVSMDGQLAQRYAAADRNERLLISNMENWQPTKPEPWMAGEDLVAFAKIAIQHFVRIGHPEKVVEAAHSILPDVFGPKPKEITIANLARVYQWHSQAIRADDQNHLLVQHNYIQEQRAYIDRQAELIATLQAAHVVQPAHVEVQVERSALRRLFGKIAGG